ncbi:MAG: TonB-dependent receptor [Bacteroidetes bacterium]|nr:TonB-dependent receptor [Fibrella sp.]
MKTRLTLLFLTGLTTSGFAQFPGGGGMPGAGNQRPAVTPGPTPEPTPRGNGKISGVLMDSTTNKPVEFATIALLNPQTGKPIDGTTSDDKGRYTLTRIAPGEYRLQFGFVGYKNKESALVKIERGTELLLGLTKMSPDVRTLGEVQVVGQAALIEEKVDRLVYNADKDITAKGGDASDIMRKVPMLSVDLDGNVSLRGSSNVRVLINNKPSTIVSSSVADALKQIPADMIKSVEVITSPSAKYDAEGSAGIINIITKKNTLQGLTLNTDVGQGNRGTSLNVNGSYRQGKMGFNLGGFGRAEYNVRGRFTNVQTAGATTQIQTAATRTARLFGNYQLGWDYDISKNSSLTASLRYGARNGGNYQDGLRTETYSPLGPNLSFTQAERNVRTIDRSGTLDANLTYTRTYARPQQELSVLALYSRNNRTNNFVADILGGTDFETITSRQRNDNPSVNQESTLQVDYQTPIKSNQILEVGAKGIFRQVDSRYQYFRALSTDAGYELDPTRPANGLNYDQNIAASYVAYTYATKSKYTLKAGFRYEYTFIDASFTNESTSSAPQGSLTNPSSVSAIPNYGNLVPSINISKALKGGKIVKLGYNRRIQRPGIQFLNPNVNASNPTNISVGEPTLSPEITDNVELGLSGQVKAFYINATLFARRTNGEITSVRDIDSTSAGDPLNPVFQRVIRTSYQNIGRQDAVGVNLFTNITLFSKWQIGGGIDFYHVNLTNNVADPIYRASNSGFVASGRMNTSLALSKGWALQGFAFTRGRQVQLQGYQGAFGFYGVGVRKEFNEKRGTVGVSAENFLNYPFTVRSQFQSPVLTQNSQTDFYNAGFRVNFSYRIGKMSFDQPQRRKRSINNDDEKSEGGGDQPQQAAPAGGNGGGGRRGGK